MNYLKSLPMLALLMAGTATFQSCGSDESTPAPMNETTKKSFIDQVAQELAGEVPETDFNEFSTRYNEFMESYADRLDMDEIGRWAISIIEENTANVGGAHTDRIVEKDNYDDITYKRTTITNFSYYKCTILASNFLSEFTLRGDGKWDRKNSNAFRIVCDDYVLSVVPAGANKPLHFTDDVDNYFVDYRKISEYETEDEYNCEETKYVATLPERVLVTLSYKGTKLVDATLNFNIKDLAGEEIDIAKSSVSMQSSVTLSNGYKINNVDLTAKGNSRASSSMSVSNARKRLVSATISSDLAGFPSYIYPEIDEDAEEPDMENAEIKNGYVNIDVLNKLNITGKVNDILLTNAYLEELDNSDYDEREFKAALANLNNSINLGLYYNGKPTKQADIVFEARATETWDDKTKWEAVPVITFDDGTSYTTFDDLLNSTELESSISVIQDLLKRYAAMFK